MDPGPFFDVTAIDSTNDEIVIAGQRNVSGTVYPWASHRNGSNVGQWAMKYDVGTFGRFTRVIEVDGGDFLAVGFTQISGDAQMLAVKIDGSDGSVIWHRTYGGSSDAEIAWDAGEIDAGYVIVGQTTMNDAQNDPSVWVLIVEKSTGGGVSGGDFVTFTFGATSLDGQFLFGGGEPDVGYAVAVTDAAGNEFVVAGYTESFGDGGKDGLAIKLDTDSLNTLVPPVYRIAYGDTGDEVFYSAAVSGTNGNVILAGSEMGLGSTNGSSTDEDIWLVMVDSDGGIDWQRSYYADNTTLEPVNRARRVIELDDGNLLVTGWLGEDDRMPPERDSVDAFLLLLDPTDGTPTGFDQLYYDINPGSDWNDAGWGVAETPDDTDNDLFLSAATVEPAQVKRDGWILRLDSNGEVDTTDCDFDSPLLDDETTAENDTETFSASGTETSTSEGSPSLTASSSSLSGDDECGM